ncbi:50S ribosome-binding GTPase [Myceligenerans halotolerans]
MIPVPGPTLLDRTRVAVDLAREAYAGTEHAARLDALRARLDEPLRVAVAGRVKAGKSTLLNALVGERLAPTDAGECTRIVTWYQDGHTYGVTAGLRDGGRADLTFHRDDGALEIDLNGLAPDDVERLEVSWPSQALRTWTLVDTPGIGSLDPSSTERTWDLLADDETPADAVVYLMRHLHPQDVAFLDAFHDTEVSRPNPVNAIGVLSRADEIGVGRIDALASARRIAGRLRRDATVRRMVQTVVPVAGLLAETAATLTEDEVARLRQVAALPVADAEDLLLSADRFVDREPGLGLTGLERTALLERFGLFGLRLATVLLRQKAVATATELARELTARSGVGELRAVLDSLFVGRRDVLKSRSALLALDALLAAEPVPGGDRVATVVEQVVASAHAFAELRVLSALRAGWVTGPHEALTDLERLVGGDGATSRRRLDLPADASTADVTDAARGALDRWTRRAENPLSRRELVLAARVAVRSVEGLLDGPRP